MGEVYRARDTRLGRDVAVKVLPVATATSPEAVARFDREGRAIAALNHPNICTLFDVGTTDGHPYLVMELLEGHTVHQALTGGPLSVAAVLAHGIALADGLHAAHGRGIVHRDLKPANVFLTNHGTVKILDFGLAKEDGQRPDDAHMTEAALTGPGTTLGTVAYMSPEQLRAEAVDARTDLVALGLVLYEMATGRRAFGGKTTAEVSAAILHLPPAAPRSLRADLPEKLEEIILKALENDRELRYQSAAELRADLKRLRRETVDTDAPAVAPGSSTLPAAVPPPSSDAALVVGLVRRHPVAVSAVALALVTAAGAIWWAVGDGTVPLARSEISMDPLTFDGHAGHATISADGRFIAYVRRDLTNSSVVVKQLGSNSDVVIMPSSAEADYYAPSITPDGSYVDVLVDARRNPEDERFIVRVPLLGGAPRRLIEGAASGLGWSPDGRRMAFVRFVERPLRSALVVADAEGRSQRVVVTLAQPRVLATSFHGGGRFEMAPSARPSWSPDGRYIAVSAVNTGVPESELIAVDVATGEPTYRRIEQPARAFAHEVAALSGDRLIGSHMTADGSEQWWLHPRTGPAVQLTPDLNDLRGVQLTGDRTAAVATRTVVRSSITVGAVTDRTFVEAVAPSTARPGFAQFDASGRLYYMARVPGSLATFRSDGAGGAGSLVAADLTFALPAPDGAFVVGFTRSFELARRDAGGSGITVLAPPSGMFPVAITPDGASLVYVSNVAGPQQPWLVPLAGGEPRRLAETSIPAPFMRLSRDGRSTIFPSPAGTQLCRFPSFDECRTVNVRSGPLSADGRAVFAINPTDPRNLIVQPLDGGPSAPLTAFADGTIQDFSLSPDGTRIAITRMLRESDVVLIKGFQ